MRGRWVWANCWPAASLVFVVGCSVDAPANRSVPPADVATAASATAFVPGEAAVPPDAFATPAIPGFTLVAFPGARSVAVAATDTESVVVAYGQGEGLFVARSEDGGRTFGEAVPATGDRPVHVMPIERPAVAVTGGEWVGVAWLELPPDGNGGAVWYAGSTDGGRSFAPGTTAAADEAGETTMVSVALDAEGDPVLSWLNGSALRFVRSVDRGSSFQEVQRLGDGTCECCQPHVVARDEDVLIAYRSLAADPEKGFARDLALIRSANGGATFEPVTPVSDAHWYLEACPIAGPSLAVRADEVFVAWMDGRNEPPGTLSRGDVWLAASTDGGATFGPNVRINAATTRHHTLPTIGLGPGGRIHAAWQADGEGGRVLYHTVSDDKGLTFAPPVAIADGADKTRGQPNMPTLAVSPQGRVALAWVDRKGANVATWSDTSGSSPP